MYPFPNLTEPLRDFLKTGLVISPWLSAEGASDRFDAAIFDVLNEHCDEFMANHWNERELLRTFGDLPISERVPRTAVYEIAASTAAYLALEESEAFQVDSGTVARAFERIDEYTSRLGFGRLIQVYTLVTGYENQHALDYYGAIPEQEFIRGYWHRPWVDYSLSDELLGGIVIGNYRIVVRGMRRYVELTDQGRRALQYTTRVLQESGYLKHRLSMLHVSQFNLFKDYAKLAQEISPDFRLTRRRFLDFSEIRPGQRVLELGCGAGVFTFDDGLANRVSPGGSVTGLDPSVRMVARGVQTGRKLDIPWVEFLVGKAEQIPFPDNTFDATVGSAFIHFTELEEACAEMGRVTRPGGTIASLHPLKLDLEVPFFREWFSPILDLAARRNEPPQDFSVEPDQVPQAFSDAGYRDIEVRVGKVPARFHDPEKVIQHFIHGIGWFYEELAGLPWRARQEVISVLKDKGRAVCRKYPARDRILYWPFQMVKGRAPD